MPNLKKPFELKADDFHYNGHKAIFFDYKTEEHVAEELARYCSPKTIIRELISKGVTLNDIKDLYEEHQEEFGDNLPPVLVHVFEQFHLH